MNAVLFPVFQGLGLLCEILAMAIFVNSIMSWISPMGQLRTFLNTFCEPLVAPFRALLDKFGMTSMQLDFAPTIAMLVLFMLSSLFSSFARGF